MEGFSMPRFYRNHVDLFSPDEHAVLANWLGLRPPKSAKGIDPDEAMARLGFEKEPGHYRLIDAVVAFIVLENAEKRLPGWSAVRADGSFLCARNYRDDDKVPDRKVLLQSRRLLVINWADSGPGFSWPVAYYVTWLPVYDRFVVTASADCPDGFGYCDFAIGAFGSDKSIKEGARSVVCGDWKDQWRAWEQQPWAYLFNTGLISHEEANAWREEVWPTEPEEDEEDVVTGEIPAHEIDPKTGEAHTSEEMFERAQDMSALATPGALGTSEGELTSAMLGATPMLRPALKYNGRIYKAPVGGQHLDVIPASVYPEFQRQAMSGEDISKFNFGFMNHEGQFMNREQAMDYAVKEGLIDPRDAGQGVLTTTNLEVMPNTQEFTEAVESEAAAGGFHRARDH
jgi:hypothetical protein